MKFCLHRSGSRTAGRRSVLMAVSIRGRHGFSGEPWIWCEVEREEEMAGFPGRNLAKYFGKEGEGFFLAGISKYFSELGASVF